MDRDTLAQLLMQQQMQGPNAGFNAGQMPPTNAFNPEPTMPTMNAPPGMGQQSGLDPATMQMIQQMLMAQGGMR